MSVKVVNESNLSQQVKDNNELFLHYNRAQVALAQKELKTAMKETQVFSTKAEANKNINQIRFGHELQGRIALAEKKADIAIKELIQANQQNPYDLYRLAIAYQMQGNKEKAKEYFTKAANFNGLPAVNYAFIRSKAAKMVTNL
jgi:tetratricopeptide (TPR) repeat protein